MHIKSIHFYQTTEEGMHFHAHAAYQLHVVVSGGGGYEFSNHKIAHVAPGSVFVIPPQWPHKIVLKNKKSLISEYLIGITAEPDDPAKTFLDNELGKVRVFNAIAINRKFFEMKREQFCNGNAHARQAAIFSLLAWIYEFYANHCSGQRAIAKEQPDEIEHALAILQQNVSRQINLGVVAREIGLNRYSLVRKFTRQLGISPMKYFARLKLDYAAVLLRETDLKIYEIADRLQFADQFHFSKKFKAAYRKTPLAYRHPYRINV